MDDRKKRSSNFAGPYGIALLGIIGAVSCYFQIYTLGGTLFFFCLIFLFAWLWSRYALARLEVSVTEGEWSGFPGEKVRLSCRIKNNKLLPLLWLEAAFPMPDNHCIGQGLRRRILAVRWHEELTFDLEEKAGRRGICMFSDITLASGDGFGLNVREKKEALPYPVSVIVYPEIVPVHVDRILQSFSEVQQGEKGYLEDATLLKMNRAYEPQDSARKINWRQLAAQGRLMTNVYETMLPRIVSFVLDLSAFRKEVEDSEGRLVKRPLEEELERMLSFTASCVTELIKGGASCRIFLPKASEEKDSFRGEGWEGLLSQLAEVEYDGTDRYFSEEEAEEIHARPGIHIFVTKDYPSFTGKEVFLPQRGGKQILLAMSDSRKDGECPWDLMYAREFLTEESREETRNKSVTDKRKNDAEMERMDRGGSGAGQ